MSLPIAFLLACGAPSSTSFPKPHPKHPFPLAVSPVSLLHSSLSPCLPTLCLAAPFTSAHAALPTADDDVTTPSKSADSAAGASAATADIDAPTTVSGLVFVLLFGYKVVCTSMCAILV